MSIQPAGRARVAFCGHATIAIVVAPAKRQGTEGLRRTTLAGEVAVETRGVGGRVLATPTSVPPGGVVEDPATGAAAAAFGGYLRSLGLVVPPARITVRQGEDMGRPSRLLVDVPAGDAGIGVSGTAAPMAG